MPVYVYCKYESFEVYLYGEMGRELPQDDSVCNKLEKLNPNFKVI